MNFEQKFLSQRRVMPSLTHSEGLFTLSPYFVTLKRLCTYMRSRNKDLMQVVDQKSDYHLEWPYSLTGNLQRK